MALAPSEPLLAVPSSASISASMRRCSLASKPSRRGPISSSDGVDGLLDALAAVALLVTVTALDRLERAGGGAGGNGGAGDGAVVEGDLDLDGGVAAGVEDLPRADCFDAGH